MGKSVKTLTNHKKAIRSMAIHPDEYTFVSSSADNCKVSILIRFGNAQKVVSLEILEVTNQY